MTDESLIYPKVGREFAGHGSVNHSVSEYVRAGFWHTNTAEKAVPLARKSSGPSCALADAFQGVLPRD